MEFRPLLISHCQELIQWKCFLYNYGFSGNKRSVATHSKN